MASLFDRLQAEIEANERGDGISPVDLLDLPSEIATLIKRIIRLNGMRLTQVAQELGATPEQAQQSLDELVAKGYVRRVEVKGELWYKARFAKKRSRSLSSAFWRSLDLLDSDS